MCCWCACCPAPAVMRLLRRHSHHLLKSINVFFTRRQRRRRDHKSDSPDGTLFAIFQYPRGGVGYVMNALSRANGPTSRGRTSSSNYCFGIGNGGAIDIVIMLILGVISIGAFTYTWMELQNPQTPPLSALWASFTLSFTTASENQALLTSTHVTTKEIVSGYGNRSNKKINNNTKSSPPREKPIVPTTTYALLGLNLSNTQQTTLAIQEAVTRFDQLLDQYEQEHSIEALQSLPKESLCHRSFVFPSRDNFDHCISAGNRLGAYVNDFAWAIVLNKTIVLPWSRRHCFHILQLRDWVVTIDQLIRLKAAAGCPLKRPTPSLNNSIDNLTMDGSRNDAVFASHPWTWNHLSQFIGGQPHANIPIACCDLQSLRFNPFNTNTSLPFITFRSWYFPIYDSLFYVNINTNYTILSIEAQWRMKILFNAVFGQFLSFGKLADRLFSFSVDSVHNVQTHIIRSISYHNLYRVSYNYSNTLFNQHFNNIQSSNSTTSTGDDTQSLNSNNTHNPLIIGLHLRHQNQNNDYEEEFDHCSIQCVSNWLNKTLSSTDNHHGMRDCILLVAADRLASYQRLVNSSLSDHCYIITSSNISSSTVHSKDNVSSPATEHGPLGDSFTSFQDWNLLSQATHFFGSTGSTFSSLIASSIAYRYHRHQSMMSSQDSDSPRLVQQAFHWIKWDKSKRDCMCSRQYDNDLPSRPSRTCHEYPQNIRYDYGKQYCQYQ